MFYQSNFTYCIDMEKIKDFSYEIGPGRPPSEGRACSLLIRATRYCPWNRCQFCVVRRGSNKFEYRDVEEVKKDIDTAKALVDELKSASWKLGYGGEMNNEVLTAIIRGNPEVYSKDLVEPDELEQRLSCLIHLANWLGSGGKTAFLQDSDSLIMRTHDLVELIRYLKETFPSIERVTTYARAKTCLKKSLDELKELHGVGLSRVHVGLESGYDRVLTEMQKGINAEEHIRSGRKVIEGGISLSEYVMPGLGGRKWSEPHALETARILNEIGNADFIRIRSLIVFEGTTLFEKYQAGEFEQLAEDEIVDEIGLLIENLDCNSYLTSDHMWNLLLEVEGWLPQERENILRVIEQYKEMQPMEKLEFKLKRRLGSYQVYGALDPQLNQMVQEAWGSVRKQLPDAETKVEKAISALKQRG